MNSEYVHSNWTWYVHINCSEIKYVTRNPSVSNKNHGQELTRKGLYMISVSYIKIKSNCKC